MNNITFSKILALVGIATLLILGSCSMPRAFANSGIPSVAVVAQTPTTSQVPSPGSDQHFVMVDDYFIMEQDLGTQSYVYATIAKMVVAPDGNNNAKFLRAMDNQEIFTRYFGKTRKAVNSDYQIDRKVYFLNYSDSFGNYRAPESSAEARNGWWIHARITDISEIHKGFLSTSGGYNVNLNALRVAVQ